MSRDRFRQIKSYFILFDIQKRKEVFEKYGWFYQIEEFKSKILESSKKNYVPSPQLWLYESMVLITGYHPDRIYIP